MALRNACTNILYDFLHLRRYGAPSHVTRHTDPVNMPQAFGPVRGFRVRTPQGSYDMEHAVDKPSVVPVTVTNGTNCYSLRYKYDIRSDKRLIDFYNRVFTDMSSQVQV